MYELHCGNCIEVLKTLPDESVQCCVTSPPYFNLRSYLPEGHPNKDAEIGREKTPKDFTDKMVSVFGEVRRVLKNDGVCWINMGDGWAANRTYRVPDSKHTDVGNSAGMSAKAYGLKPKDLMGIPWRLAFALQDDGWYLRCDIIWNKPGGMCESVKDRPTKVHEYVFLLSKSERYYYDSESVREPCSESSLKRISQPNFLKQKGGPKDYANGVNPSRSSRKTLENFAKNPGRNLRAVWNINNNGTSEAHFATYPEELVVPCVKAGSRLGDTILDPFSGSGTTGKVAIDLGRNFVGIDLNPEYLEMTSRERLRVATIMKESQLDFSPPAVEVKDIPIVPMLDFASI